MKNIFSFHLLPVFVWIKFIFAKLSWPGIDAPDRINFKLSFTKKMIHLDWPWAYYELLCNQTYIYIYISLFFFFSFLLGYPLFRWEKIFVWFYSDEYFFDFFIAPELFLGWWLKFLLWCYSLKTMYGMTLMRVVII